MSRTKYEKRRLVQRVCGGCISDRYNHPGLCERPGIDAPVTSEFCWHADNIRYNRSKRCWECPCKVRR